MTTAEKLQEIVRLAEYVAIEADFHKGTFAEYISKNLNDIATLAHEILEGMK